MSRGGSCGGGQSSLGYLFGSSKNQQPHVPAPTPQPPQQTPYRPPYGIDTTADHRHPSQILVSIKPDNIINNTGYRRPEGHHNTGNFITDRPSTKVRSVPGGDSSLGYLFEDK